MDSIANILADRMERDLGRAIAVEAKPGLTGMLAAAAVAKAAPDGRRLLVLPAAYPAHGTLSPRGRFSVEDFTWISTLSVTPLAIAVRSGSPFHTLSELIEAARKKPETLAYGSAGADSIPHATAALLGRRTGVRFTPKPYRGEAAAIAGLLAGEVDFIAAPVDALAPLVASGQLRALAVAGPLRSHRWPAVPTVAETVAPDFASTTWTGLAAPAGLPRPVLDRLNAEVRGAVAAPDVRGKIEAVGGVAKAATPEEMKALVERQTQAWKTLAAETAPAKPVPAKPTPAKP